MACLPRTLYIFPTRFPHEPNEPAGLPQFLLNFTNPIPLFLDKVALGRTTESAEIWSTDVFLAFLLVPVYLLLSLAAIRLLP